MNEETPKTETALENPEGFVPVELLVEEPDPVHNNFKISFNCKDLPSCAAYNRAIEKITEERAWNPFHQSGVTPTSEHSPGYHMWEFLKQLSKEEIEIVIPDLQARARKEYVTDKELGFHDIWLKKRE